MIEFEKPPMLSPEDAAKRLRVPYRTINIWLHKGLLRGTRVGKHWRIEQEDLEEFIRRGMNSRHTQAS